MNHRQNNVLLTDSNGNPDFAASYTVIACPVGAVASAAASGTSVAVDAGHGFRAGDKVLIWNGTTETATFVAEALDSVTATTLVWSSATPTIAKTNLLVNLGPDTASGATPAYDKSPMYVYTDADGDDAITNSTITCDTTGNYDYWTFGDGANWELIRDSSGTVAGVVPGWSGVSGRRNICDYGAVGDGSTDNAGRINQTVVAANGGVVWIPGGPNSDYYCDSQLTLVANTKLLGDSDATLYKNYSIATNGVGDAFIVTENAAAGDAGIEIGGFEIDLGATTYTGDIIGVRSNGLYIHDLYIKDFGATGTGGRAIVYVGDSTKIVNVRAVSDLDETGNGGILCFGGNGHVVANCHVQAGDDCYGAWCPTSGSWGNINLSNYTLSNCYGLSNAARLFFAGSGTGVYTAACSDINVQGLVGDAENGLVHVNIPNASSSGTVKNVRISNFVCDGAVNDEANYAILVQDAADNDLIEEVHISNGHLRVTGSASAISLAPIYFANVNRCSIKDCDIDATSQTAAQLGIIVAEDCQDIEVNGNTLRCNSSVVLTSDNWAAIQMGSGTNEVVGFSVCNNHIIDVPAGLNALTTPSAAIFLPEASNGVVMGNRISLGSGNSGSAAIRDLGGTVEGNNVIVGNELIDFFGEDPPIIQLEEGDCVYESNLGHNLCGVESYTADSTPAQGDVPLRAKLCLVTTGAEDRSVTMPEAISGRRITIYNLSSFDLQIYPASGDDLGDGADDPMFLAGPAQATLIAVSTSLWIVESGTLKSTSA